MRLKCDDGVTRSFDTCREMENKDPGRPELGAEVRWWFRCDGCGTSPGLDSTNDFEFAKKRARKHRCVEAVVYATAVG